MIIFKLLKKFLTFVEGTDSLRMFMKSCNWINFNQFYVFFPMHYDTIVTVSNENKHKIA